MPLQSRRLFYVLAFESLLLIPFFGMLYSSEVNWSIFDFAVMAALLLFLALGIETIGRKLRNKKLRIASITFVILLFLLIWVEMAVGIFGTPLAGS